MIRIILLGPPGAGKGTQAKELSRRLALTHISTGDILRKNASAGTPLGKEAQDFMNKGLLVPDALVEKMLACEIDSLNNKNGFILDGYPRNINQAEALTKMLKIRNMDSGLVIYLEASEAVIIQRLSGRLVCSICGMNFHTANMPPKVKGICDSCGGALYQRNDDKEETIRKRLQVYNKEAVSLLKYYEKKHELQRLAADGDSELILSKVISLAQKQNDSLKV